MTISAVLLAGGESRRMKEDKATLLVRGRPLWQHQLEILRKVEPAEIFVSAQIDPEWRPGDAAFVPDVGPSRGPLSGIVATLSRTASAHLLALAIDMPFMTASYLRGLCEKIHLDCGVVPLIGNRAEPLAAIYPQSAHLDLQEALSGDDFSLQPLIARLIAAGKLRALYVSKEERSLFRNLNEPADLHSS